MTANTSTRELLKSKLEEMQTRLEKLKVDASQSHSTDSSEQAQERENDEVVDAIGNETRETIIEIQRALSRLDEGEYGNCITCGEAINDGRLQVKPEASQCVQCAS